MIEARGLSKRYGETLAVDDVSFRVERGEIVGFLGPNGAGKSTTMKVLTCYLAPSEGTAEIDGNDILHDPLAARAAVGYLPENTPLYTDMGVLDFLRYMGRLQGVAGDRIESRVDELVRLCDISPMAHKDIGELSKGYRQRVGLAQALLHDPPVLILDEPTSGLDPAQIVEIRALIRRISEQKAILLSTHILPEAQNTCDRILIINRGRLVGEGTPGELLNAAAGREVYTVSLKGGTAGTIRERLEKLPHATTVETIGDSGVGLQTRDGGPEGPPHFRFRLSANQGADLRENIFDLAVSGGLKLLELNHVSTTLEDVFLKLTASDPATIGGVDVPSADIESAESVAKPEVESE
ncbi:MAG: ABC transporter ATP-binding protein [bacterium]|nr:ABC transporter ATP-binding protein [bacterium]